MDGTALTYSPGLGVAACWPMAMDGTLAVAVWLIAIRGGGLGVLRIAAAVAGWRPTRRRSKIQLSLLAAACRSGVS
jgi:predicted anti-sigma-YlaC factor YlaD